MQADHPTPTMARFQSEFVAYAAIHQNGMNRFLHLLGIPVIVVGLQALLFSLGGLYAVAAFSALASMPIFQRSFHAGFTLLGFFALLAPVAVLCVSGAPIFSGLMYSALLFVLGWAIQFLGHFFEKRHPELLDSPINILIGPLFITYEVMPFLKPFRLDRDNTTRGA